MSRRKKLDKAKKLKRKLSMTDACSTAQDVVAPAKTPRGMWERFMIEPLHNGNPFDKAGYLRWLLHKSPPSYSDRLIGKFVAAVELSGIKWRDNLDHVDVVSWTVRDKFAAFLTDWRPKNEKHENKMDAIIRKVFSLRRMTKLVNKIYAQESPEGEEIDD